MKVLRPALLLAIGGLAALAAWTLYVGPPQWALRAGRPWGNIRADG